MKTNGGRFFLIGSLRSGSSLLARCLDDHPQVICLCESEINRTLFPGYYYSLHLRRMINHGINYETIIKLLDGKEHGSLDAIEMWYRQIFPILKKLYGKPEARMLGDKSPDFYISKELMEHLLNHYKLIYTARDPRAIFRSIQADSTDDKEKERRWRSFLDNVAVWKDYFERENILIVRFEDLVTAPILQMERVHNHLGLEHSVAFLEKGKRKFPRRFLWQSTIDMKSGHICDFNAHFADKWKQELSEEEFGRIGAQSLVQEYAALLGYSL